MWTLPAPRRRASVSPSCRGLSTACRFGNPVIDQRTASHREDAAPAGRPGLGTIAGFALLILLLPVLPARALLPAGAPWVEVVSSFALHGVLLAIAAALALAWQRRWLRAASFLLLLVPDAIALVPTLFESTRVDRPLGTVLTANLGQSPEAVISVAEQIEALEPDLVWLSEFPDPVPEAVRARFEEIEERYLYGVAWPAATGRSLKFLSRFPLRARDVFEPERAPGRPALRLLLDADGIPLVVFALHTHPPIAQWALDARDETLEWAARTSSASKADTLLMGDLNTSVYAPRFARFVRASSLRCETVWRCAVGSWPSWAPFMATPIDHVLAGGGLVVTSLRRGEATGSDHYPVIAEVAYRGH